MTLDQIFAEAERRGLRLTNCFQFGPNNLFRANWCDERGGHPFGEAPTAAGALEMALKSVPKRETPAPPSGDFEDLLD